MWLVMAFLAISALLFFFKYCQYHALEFLFDSSATANVCYNLAHGCGWACTVSGVSSYFAIHFVPFLALMAPVLLIWNNLLALAAIQTLIVASMPLAVFFLAERRAGSSLAGFVALWLAVTSPYLFHLAAAGVYPGLYLSAFFLWGVAFAERGRLACAAISFGIMLLCIEESCIVFFGLCLYYAATKWSSSRRSANLSCFGALAAVVLFALESRLRASYPESANFRGWEMFRHLGPTPAAVLRSAITSPGRFLLDLVYPMSKLEPIWRLLASTGGIALLSPSTLAVFAVNFLPHFLASPADFYHQIVLQYAGYVVGPLWWSLAAGTAYAFAFLDRRGQSSWLVVFALVINFLDIRQQPAFLQPKMHQALFIDAPSLLPTIPKDASVWTIERAAGPLACRSFLKIIGQGLDVNFLGQLFKPDYIVISRDYPRTFEPAARASLLTFIGQEGYLKVAEGGQMIILRHPNAPLGDSTGKPPALSGPFNPGPMAARAEALLERNDYLGFFQVCREGAEQNSAPHEFNLGLLYAQGVGGAPKDKALARYWWQRAAEQRYTLAQSWLGMSLLRSGNVEEGVRWLRAAAANGDATAATELSSLSRANHSGKTQ